VTTLTTWVDVPADHPFGPANLPYGVFSTADTGPRVGVRIGDWVLDVSEVARTGREAVGVGDGPDLTAAWERPSLNAFLDLGRPAWTVAREWLTEVVTDRVHEAAVRPHLVPLADVALHLPFEVGDYVDFYASEHHATNVGRIFRPGADPLTPN
jgi:fumarylacetoacetase